MNKKQYRKALKKACKFIESNACCYCNFTKCKASNNCKAETTNEECRKNWYEYMKKENLS